MANSTLTELFQSIARAIKAKIKLSGYTPPEKMSPERFATYIGEIQQGYYPGATATSSDILSGKTAYVGAKKITGTASGFFTGGASMSAPKGWFIDRITSSGITISDSGRVNYIYIRFY